MKGVIATRGGAFSAPNLERSVFCVPSCIMLNIIVIAADTATSQ